MFEQRDPGELSISQGQGLGRWSYARVIARILIAVTLITVGYAGLEHVVLLNPTVTRAVEVSLVVIRSILTVLYGQAIHPRAQCSR